MANWKKITTDSDLTTLSSSLTTTDQAISASSAALSGSASDARNLLVSQVSASLTTTDQAISSSVASLSGSASDARNLLAAQVSGSFTSVSASLTTTDQAISASVAALSGSASDARSLLEGGNPFPHTGSAIVSGSFTTIGDIAATGSVNFVKTEPGAAGWTTLGATLNDRRDCIGGLGTTNAALAIGGSGVGASVGNCTEEYNGTSWTTGGALSEAGDIIPGAGSTTAGLAAGGGGRDCCTEEYDGTSWSAGGALGYVGYGFAMGNNITGTQTAALSVGGYYSYNRCTQVYNGSTWSFVNAMSTGGMHMGASGTTSAGLAFGGYSMFASPFGRITEEYNGSTWSTGGNLNTPMLCSHGDAGTQDSTLAFGGYYGGVKQKCTEAYDGTAWTVQAAMNSTCGRLGGAGNNNSSALAFGGGGYSNVTEEYASGADTVNIKVNYNDETGVLSACDLSTDSLQAKNITFSGSLAVRNSDTTITIPELTVAAYAWSTSANLSTSRKCGWSGYRFGSGNANILSIGGVDSFNVKTAVYSTTVEEYDDEYEVWKGSNNVNLVRTNAAGGKNLIAGGLSDASSLSICSEYSNPTIGCEFGYLSSPWETAPALNTPRQGLGMADHFAFGGGSSNNLTRFNCTEFYNCLTTTWSTCANMNVARTDLGGNILCNASNPPYFLATGGVDGTGILSCTEVYNESTNTWSTCNGMSTKRLNHGASPSGDISCNASIVFGGQSCPSFGLYYTTCTEEFDMDTNTWASRGALPHSDCEQNGGGAPKGTSTPMAFSSEFGSNNEKAFQSYKFNHTAFPQQYDDILSYSSGSLEINADRNASTAYAKCTIQGKFTGCLEGQASFALQSQYSSISATANTASYVEANSVDYSALTHYADDAAAAAGGVPIGSLYRNGNFIVIRLT